MAPPEPKEEEYWENLCDHRDSLRRFGKVFGAESVRPRLFVPDGFVGNSLVMDFLCAACIDLPRDELLFPGRENESISAFGLEVLRRLNVRQPMYQENGALNRIREGVPDLFQLAFKSGEKFRLPAEAVNKYRIAYEASNEWVRQQYFPDREKLFPPALRDHKQLFDLADSEIEELVDLLNLILIAKSQQEDALTIAQLMNLLGRKFYRKAERAAKVVVLLPTRLIYLGKRWIMLKIIRRLLMPPNKGPDLG
jgi:hypothetical protein